MKIVLITVFTIAIVVVGACYVVDKFIDEMDKWYDW